MTASGSVNLITVYDFEHQKKPEWQFQDNLSFNKTWLYNMEIQALTALFFFPNIFLNKV